MKKNEKKVAINNVASLCASPALASWRRFRTGQEGAGGGFNQMLFLQQI